MQFQTRSGNKYDYNNDSGIISLNNSQDSERTKLIDQLNQTYRIEKNLYIFNETSISQFIDKFCLNELILEVTTKCNLNCTYCIFGEHYDELRSTENDCEKKMTFETAKKAIDMYYEKFIKAKVINPERIPVVSFYGGEPLLNFTLIKQCTEYITSKYKNEDTFFTLTSNGVLINDEIIDFFIKYDFHPIFSLDGDEIEHDKHRVFHNGKGSFNIIMKNLTNYYSKSQQVIFVNTVYSIDTDLGAVINFFENNQQFLCINIGAVNQINTSYYDNYTPEQYQKFNLMLDTLLDEYYEIIKHSKHKSIDKNANTRDRMYILDLLFTRTCMPIIMRKLFNPQQEGIQFTSTCIPSERIFVDVDGYLYPCEKLSRSRNIGDVDSGLDMKKIVDYTNDYIKVLYPKCSKCEINNLCEACFNTFLTDGEFIRPKNFCQNKINNLKNDLAHYCYVNEINNEWLAKFRSNYYERINKMVVTLR